MTPYFSDGQCQIYLGDCRDIAPSLQADVIITDPPYGMAWNTDSTRFSGGNIRRRAGREDYGGIAGDADTFDPSPWLAYRWAVLFGANHYASALPVGTTLVWIKREDHLFGSFLSDAEIAWRKGGHGVYCFRKQFPPPSRMGETKTGLCVHPTQKPVALMEWCIARSGAPNGATILDPFMGSGTTLRAAKDLGRRAIGVEISERYCEIAAKRLSQQVLDFAECAK